LKDHVAPQTKAAFDEIAQEQLARNIAFLGQDRVEKIKGSFVIIVGLGGVGKKKRKTLFPSTSSSSWTSRQSCCHDVGA